MGELVVTEFLTVDGVFEDPAGWVPNRGDGEIAEDAVGLFRELDSGSARFKIGETLEAEAMLLGRHTYEQFAALWPGRTGRFADKMNAMPKYVVSTTSLDSGEWDNTTLIRGDDPVAEISQLKEARDGTILVHASGALVKLLLDNDLVDELRLLVFPVVLGQGRRLFESATRTLLHLADVSAVGDKGVILQVYRPRA